MNNDLVKRLRNHIAVVFDNKGHVFESETLCDEAADEIEKLQARVAELEDVLGALVFCEDAEFYPGAIAPERIWMDPDIKFPECEKQYECDVRAEMLKGQTMSDNTDDMNDFVLLAIARDEAVSRVKELEAKLAKAVDALRGVMMHMPDYADTVWTDARTTLTELTGGKDE
jgi:hypothetical protein